MAIGIVGDAGVRFVSLPLPSTLLISFWYFDRFLATFYIT
jgi:hypothetical protein